MQDEVLSNTLTDASQPSFHIAILPDDVLGFHKYRSLRVSTLRGKGCKTCTSKEREAFVWVTHPENRDHVPLDLGHHSDCAREQVEDGVGGPVLLQLPRQDLDEVRPFPHISEADITGNS